jgi:hypothetical protein
MDVRIPNGWVSFAPKFKAGDPPPSGYCDWHDWANVQHKAGLRQVTCGKCSKWKYPQELSDQTITSVAYTKKHGGKKVTLTRPVCLECGEAAALVKEAMGL